MEWAIWDDDVLVIPASSIAPPAHEEMPKGVAGVYAEAASVAHLSPRAAAALLRLAIEQLVRNLGGEGNLSHAIGELVKMGLPHRVQQALDVVRVIGNKAIHPGDLSDEPEDGVVQTLFALVNVIVDVMIAQPAEIEALYSSLPDGVQAHIAERDRESKMPEPE